jgi:hypothetical protein
MAEVSIVAVVRMGGLIMKTAVGAAMKSARRCSKNVRPSAVHGFRLRLSRELGGYSTNLRGVRAQRCSWYCWRAISFCRRGEVVTWTWWWRLRRCGAATLRSSGRRSGLQVCDRPHGRGRQRARGPQQTVGGQHKKVGATSGQSSNHRGHCRTRRPPLGSRHDDDPQYACGTLSPTEGWRSVDRVYVGRRTSRGPTMARRLLVSAEGRAMSERQKLHDADFNSFNHLAERPLVVD